MCQVSEQEIKEQLAPLWLFRWKIYDSPLQAQKSKAIKRNPLCSLQVPLTTQAPALWLCMIRKHPFTLVPVGSTCANTWHRTVQQQISATAFTFIKKQKEEQALLPCCMMASSLFKGMIICMQPVTPLHESPRSFSIHFLLVSQVPQLYAKF